jgi:hypothetical protein
MGWRSAQSDRTLLRLKFPDRQDSAGILGQLPRPVITPSVSTGMQRADYRVVVKWGMLRVRNPSIATTYRADELNRSSPCGMKLSMRSRCCAWLSGRFTRTRVRRIAEIVRGLRHAADARALTCRRSIGWSAIPTLRGHRPDLHEEARPTAHTATRSQCEHLRGPHALPVMGERFRNLTGIYRRRNVTGFTRCVGRGREWKCGAQGPITPPTREFSPLFRRNLMRNSRSTLS